MVTPSFRRIVADSSFRLATLAVVAASLIIGSARPAAASTWTNQASGGLWTNASNWSGGVPNATGAVADFSTLNITSDNTVHLNTSETVGSLLFGDTVPSNNWTLDNNGNTANALTLSVASGTPTITVNNQQATISAVIGGIQGFTDAGTGTLVLSGANTYSGTATINSGSTLNAVWSAGGAFGVFPSGGSIVDNGNLILTRDSNDARFFGIITGSGTTTITGDGGYFNLGSPGDNTARLSNQSDLTVSIGLNLFKNAQTIGALNGNGTILSNTGTPGGSVPLTIGNNGDSGTFSGVITTGTEAVAIVKVGGGTQIFTAANTYAAGTTINGGTLQLGDGITSNGSIVGNVTDNATLAFANPNSQTYSGVISGPGNLMKSGAGTLTLTAESPYDGTTTINGGALNVAPTCFLTSVNNVSIGASGTPGQNGIMNVDGNVSQSGGGGVTVGATLGSNGTLNIGVTNGGSSFFTGGGTLTINKTGTVNVGGSVGGTLGGDGNVLVNGGLLSVANNGAFNLAPTGKSVTVQNGGTFVIATPGYTTPANATFTVTGQNSTFHTANKTTNIMNGAEMDVRSGGTAVFDSLLTVGFTGGGILSVDGSGSSVSAQQLYCGSSAAGTINVTNSGSLNVGDGGLFVQAGSVTINGGSLVDQSVVVSLGGTLNFISGAISANENLEVGASGMVLTDPSGSCSISTSTTLIAGRQLTVTGSTTIDAGQTLTLVGGTLNTGSLAGAGTLAFNSGTLGIAGSDGLVIGSGSPLGANLALLAGESLNVTHTTTVIAGSTLDINGGSFSAGSLANNGRTLVDSGSFILSELNNNAGGYLFVDQNEIAIINNSATNVGEIQLGGADATLSGTATLTNTVIHGNGHVAITLANSAGGTIRVENGSLLNFDGPTTPNAGNISFLGGAATFAQPFTNSSTGLITGHGGLIFNGGFSNQGTMQLSSGGTDIYGTVTNSGAGSITTGSGSNTTFYNNVTHSGAQIRTAIGGFTVFFGNVHGAGAFTGPGTVDFEGTYLPGNAGANVSFASNVTLGNTTEITGVPTFDSGSSMTLNNGTLRFNVNSGTATVAAGVTATIASDAILELAGSVSALSSGSGRVNIVNNSAVPGLLVSGTHQQVGNVDGSGTT
jgi:autotransporter-associated beta strand protein